MNTIECIKTRRSIRKFLDKKVPDELIDIIIESGIHAPSSVDCQPWEFVIVKDKNTKHKLAKLKTEDNQEHMLTAPICIVVCVDLQKSPSRYSEDGVTATQNMLLAAHELGLGSVYITGFKGSKPKVAEQIRRILDIPDNMVPVTILPIGYPDESEELEDKSVLKVEDVIHKERWNNTQ